MPENETPVDDWADLELQEPLLQLFRYQHLPKELQAASKPFGVLAVDVVRRTPNNRERSTCLRKLREAKDCAVSAFKFVEPTRGPAPTPAPVAPPDKL